MKWIDFKILIRICPSNLRHDFDREEKRKWQREKRNRRQKISIYIYIYLSKKFLSQFAPSLPSLATISLRSRKEAETSGASIVVKTPPLSRSAIDVRSMTSRMSCTRNMKSKQAPWFRHESSSRIVAAWQEVKERESQTHAIGALRAASLERAEPGLSAVGSSASRKGTGTRWKPEAGRRGR